MSLSIKGKVAIITGGAGGIGLATVKAFLKANAAGVTIVDVSKTLLQSALATLTQEEQLRVLIIHADITSEDDTIRYVNETVKKFGQLDISVQNAGVSQARAAVQDIDVETFERVFDINVKGTFLGMKHSIKAMLASPSKGKGCSIVLTSSQLGLDGKPGVSAYAASKFAVRGLAMSAAAELGQTGIRINSICPGAVHTPMTAGAGPEKLKVIAEAAMMGRLGEPDEIADSILYLASDASRFVTGTTLKVDGGYSRWG